MAYIEWVLHKCGARSAGLVTSKSNLLQLLVTLTKK